METLSKLLALLAEYGLAGFFAILIVTIAFKVVLKHYSTGMGKLIERLTDNSHVEKSTELRYHAFFSSAHYKIVAEVPTLELSPNKPVKQQMFRDLLTVYITTMIETCECIIKLEMDDWSGEQWANEVSKKMNNLITDFHRNALALGIPEAALHKFSRWHYHTLEMLYEYITTVGSSHIYSNNLVRTNIFLMMMTLLLVTTLGDAERSLKELNGEVGGKMYKNMILEH